MKLHSHKHTALYGAKRGLAKFDWKWWIDLNNQYGTNPKKNPLSNVMLYCLGVRDRDWTRFGRFPADVWARRGRWNWAVIVGWWFILPFIAYRGKHIEWYVGWRSHGGLGAAIRKKGAK